MTTRITGLRALINKQKDNKTEFFDKFKKEDGACRELIKALHLLPQFMFNLRGDRVIIYYKCDKVLTVHKNGEIELTLSRVKKDSVLGDLFDNARKYAGTTVPLFDIDKNFNTKDKSEWLKLLLSMSAYMDEYNKGKNGVEKEIQQRIVLENNLLGKSEATDYFIIDTEYIAKTSKNDKVNNGKFDAMAVHYSEDTKLPQLAFIEVKAGNDAVCGNQKESDKKQSGVYDHWFDVVKFSNISDEFFKDKIEMLQELKELGFVKPDDKLNDCLAKKQIAMKPFQMIFVLANYDQSGAELIAELEDIEKAQKGDFRKNDFSLEQIKEFKENVKNIDLRFAVSSFMGYGLYDENMLTLEEFKKLLIKNTKGK